MNTTTTLPIYTSADWVTSHLPYYSPFNWRFELTERYNSFAQLVQVSALYWQGKWSGESAERVSRYCHKLLHEESLETELQKNPLLFPHYLFSLALFEKNGQAIPHYRPFVTRHIEYGYLLFVEHAASDLALLSASLTHLGFKHPLPKPTEIYRQTFVGENSSLVFSKPTDLQNLYWFIQACQLEQKELLPLVAPELYPHLQPLVKRLWQMALYRPAAETTHLLYALARQLELCSYEEHICYEQIAPSLIPNSAPKIEYREVVSQVQQLTSSILLKTLN